MMRLFLLLSVLLFLNTGCAPFRVIVLHDPLDAAGHNDLGVSWLVKGEADLALREFERAADLDPNWSLPLVNAGNVHALTERWKEAEGFYRKALRLDSEYVDAVNNLAVSLAAQGKMEEARPWAKKAVTLSFNPRCIDTLAEILIQLGEHSEAYAILEAALDLSTVPEVHRSLLAKKTYLDMLSTLP